MGDFFPGYALGGPDWALDLSAADPTYLMAFFTWATMQVDIFNVAWRVHAFLRVARVFTLYFTSPCSSVHLNDSRLYDGGNQV